jgi:hypothetical protein
VEAKLKNAIIMGKLIESLAQMQPFVTDEKLLDTMKDDELKEYSRHLDEINKILSDEMKNIRLIIINILRKRGLIQ